MQKYAVIFSYIMMGVLIGWKRNLIKIHVKSLGSSDQRCVVNFPNAISPFQTLCL